MSHVTSQSEDHHPDTLKASLNPGPASRAVWRIAYPLSGAMRHSCPHCKQLSIRVTTLPLSLPSFDTVAGNLAPLSIGISRLHHVLD